jgi:hypothetical protein
MFKQGLKPKVKEELIQTAITTNTFKLLINKVISINVKLYNF